MEKNEVEKCCCNVAFKLGAIKKSYEEENFSIFGNIMKNNSILIRYNGRLKFSSDITMYYVLDNDWKHIQKISMAPCMHDSLALCAIIHLGNANCISLGFHSTNEDINKALSYNFKISSNTIDDIMLRYNFEQNEALPSITTETSMSCFSIFITKIKNILNKMLK